jgi:hypothetical protein
MRDATPVAIRRDSHEAADVGKGTLEPRTIERGDGGVEHAHQLEGQVPDGGLGRVSFGPDLGKVAMVGFPGADVAPEHFTQDQPDGSRIRDRAQDIRSDGSHDGSSCYSLLP